jgi:hypothetical protein
MDQLPLENFENSRVRTFVLSKYSYVQNLASCGENIGLWKRGSFWLLIKCSHEVPLFMPKQVCLT